MFKEVYKQAMDRQNPRDGLLEEILLKSKNEALKKSKPKYNFTKITSYAASVAAVFIIALAFVVYPQLSGLHKQRRAQDNIFNKQNQEKQIDEAKNELSASDENNKPEDILTGSKKSGVSSGQNVKSGQATENPGGILADGNVNARDNSESTQGINESLSNNNENLSYNDNAGQSDGAAFQAEPQILDASDASATQEAAQNEFAYEQAESEETANHGGSSGGGGGAASRIAQTPQLTSGASGGGGAQAAGGDVIFDNASAISAASDYITVPYINAEAFRQNGVWYVSFYTENGEVITVSLNARNGALIELTRESI